MVYNMIYPLFRCSTLSALRKFNLKEEEINQHGTKEKEKEELLLNEEVLFHLEWESVLATKKKKKMREDIISILYINEHIQVLIGDGGWQGWKEEISLGLHHFPHV